jgi:hypothetical protein
MADGYSETAASERIVVEPDYSFFVVPRPLPVRRYPGRQSTAKVMRTTAVTSLSSDEVSFIP